MSGKSGCNEKHFPHVTMQYPILSDPRHSTDGKDSSGMSYDSKSIKQVIQEIERNKIFLPALQRKFVWGKHQIQLLFDSLMRNYPIGTFLFWKLSSKTANNYVFYEFLREYDQRSPFNRRKTGAFAHDEIIGVLDGQQRLSSMFIGLNGTHTEKARYKRATNDAAYQKMCLYLNLLSLPYEFNEQSIDIREERNFEFRFLTPENAKSSTSRRVASEDGGDGIEPVYWWKIGDVLSWDDDLDTDQLIGEIKKSCSVEDQRSALTEHKRFVAKALRTLHKHICEAQLLNYFEIKNKDDLEDILKIFIRVNSGGTVLSKTDLLFSTIVATWDDGREQIEELLKRINNKGDKFNFGNEFLMRCCLMLTDAPVVYKVNSFKSENVEKIQREWPAIAKSVARMVDLLVEYGFNGSLLTSQNATIIIAYYIYKGGTLGQSSKEGLRNYLIHALLNRVYSNSQDQLLSTLRNALRKEVTRDLGARDYELACSEFPFKDLLEVPLPGRKTLAVTEDDIELFLCSKKGPVSFFLLSLLYPQLRYQDQIFHQDHIHPYSRFNDGNLDDMGIAAEEYLEWYEGVGLDFSSFMEFYQKRKEILRAKLRGVLTVSNERPESQPEDWEVDDELDADELVTA